ncbi:hypothetical protein [Tenacibaculum sp. 190524A05c]|uniref:hypothetical protein n=1 Tax=Tenacibaculum platacis TaxID=3137852 RepID=UPI0032B2FE26
MKSSILIKFLLLFGVLYSCNKKTENTNSGLIENKLFGKVKSVEIKTFKNDTLKSVELKTYRKDGFIEKSKFRFEPNLSYGETIYEYNKKNKLEKEIIISNGDTTNTNLYIYNNLGLLKKEEYYENKLHCLTNFKIDSSGKIIEKNFKYVNSDGLRTFKFYYPDSLTTIIKEFLRGNPDITTEIKIYPKQNKKRVFKKSHFPKTEFGEILYHNSEGNIIKKEKYYEGKITETENYKYELDLEKNWVKSESGKIRKERKIEYYEK